MILGAVTAPARRTRGGERKGGRMKRMALLAGAALLLSGGLAAQAQTLIRSEVWSKPGTNLAQLNADIGSCQRRGTGASRTAAGRPSQDQIAAPMTQTWLTTRTSASDRVAGRVGSALTLRTCMRAKGYKRAASK